jgi:hypothetical protein
MNGLQIVQIGIIGMFLVGFITYALGVMSYVHSDKAIVDERLQRYCR